MDGYSIYRSDSSFFALTSAAFSSPLLFITYTIALLTRSKMLHSGFKPEFGKHFAATQYVSTADSSIMIDKTRRSGKADDRFPLELTDLAVILLGEIGRAPPFE